MDFNRIVGVFSLLTCLLLAVLPGEGQTVDKLMDIDDVKPGMRGYGLTVFQDSTIDTFNVEVLGVMRNIFYTKQDLIMVGVSGPYIDDAGVIAGMSGSPVYIDGKLVGALAYRFGMFPKKPIGGITPIGHMLAIRDAMELEPEPSPNGPTGRFDDRDENREGPWPKGAPFHPDYSWMDEGPSNTEYFPHAGQMFGSSSLKPISVPMVFSGFHPMTLTLFENKMRRHGLVPVSGGGVGSVNPAGALHGGSRGSDDMVEDQTRELSESSSSTLEPGSAVSAQLIRGDFNLSGTGTVTWRDEDAILAFGHPFLWAGALNIPMNEAEIITVIPDQAGSTKISTVANEVGSVLWDHTNGLYGQLGDVARMIPVELSYSDNGRTNENYHFDVMIADGWTPMLVNMAVANTIIANGRSVGERTIKLDGRIVLSGQSNIIFDDQFSGQASIAALTRDINRVLNFVFDNRFITPILESMKIEVQSSNQRKTAVIEDVWFGSDILKPGEILEVKIFLKPYRGDRLVRQLSVPIPKNISDGPVQVLVGSAQAVTQHDMTTVPQRFRPSDGPRLIELINNRRTGNRLYLKMYQGGLGGIVKGREMPGLPPSVLAVMHSERTKGSFIPIREKVVAEEAIKTDYVIVGQKLSRLTIKR